jgi:hypothetical protein
MAVSLPRTWARSQMSVKRNRQQNARKQMKQTRNRIITLATLELKRKIKTHYGNFTLVSAIMFIQAIDFVCLLRISAQTTSK